MDPKLKKYVRNVMVLHIFIGIAIVVVIAVVAVDRFGSSEVLAVEDNTKEIMAVCIADAGELWSTARDRRENKMADGDKIAISIIAAKLFEARYLQTYIK